MAEKTTKASETKAVPKAERKTVSSGARRLILAGRPAGPTRRS